MVTMSDFFSRTFLLCPKRSYSSDQHQLTTHGEVCVHVEVFHNNEHYQPGGKSQQYQRFIRWSIILWYIHMHSMIDYVVPITKRQAEGRHFVQSRLVANSVCCSFLLAVICWSRDRAGVSTILRPPYHTFVFFFGAETMKDGGV